MRWHAVSDALFLHSSSVNDYDVSTPKTYRARKVHPCSQFYLRNYLKTLVQFGIRITIYTERLLLVGKGLI